MAKGTATRFLSVSSGFTLVEVLVVLGLIAITTVAAMPFLTATLNSFQTVDDKNHAKNMASIVVSLIRAETADITSAEVLDDHSSVTGTSESYMYQDSDGNFAVVRGGETEVFLKAEDLKMGGKARYDVLFDASGSNRLKLNVRVIKDDVIYADLITDIILTGLFDFTSGTDGKIDTGSGACLRYQK